MDTVSINSYGIKPLELEHTKNHACKTKTAFLILIHHYNNHSNYCNQDNGFITESILILTVLVISSMIKD